MKHEVIWSAVDNLAKSNNMSASRMAKIVGLDSTTFNKSKRFRVDGKKRWPSLKSINKLLEYFDISFDEFCGRSLFEKFSNLPVATYRQIKIFTKSNNAFSDFEIWEEMSEESLKNLSFAIIIDTNKFEPIYKNNSTIVVSKKDDIRKGDRVFVINKLNEIKIYELIASKGNLYSFLNLESDNMRETIAAEEILLMKRIVWASQ